MKLLATALAAGPPGLAMAAPASAEVTRFEVLATDRPAFQGRTFGERGPAKKITARRPSRSSRRPA